jgi:hypothetical protein
MKNGVFWYMTPCASCKYPRFGRTHRLHHQGGKNQRVRKNVNSNWQPKQAVKYYYLCRHSIVFLRCVLRLLVTAYVVPTSPILVTLMAEAKRRLLQEPHSLTSQKAAFLLKLYTQFVTYITL